MVEPKITGASSTPNRNARQNHAAVAQVLQHLLGEDDADARVMRHPAVGGTHERFFEIRVGRREDLRRGVRERRRGRAK